MYHAGLHGTVRIDPTASKYQTVYSRCTEGLAYTGGYDAGSGWFIILLGFVGRSPVGFHEQRTVRASAALSSMLMEGPSATASDGAVLLPEDSTCSPIQYRGR